MTADATQGPEGARWRVLGPERIVRAGGDFDVVLVPVRSPGAREYDHHAVRVKAVRRGTLALSAEGSAWLRWHEYPDLGRAGWELPPVCEDRGHDHPQVPVHLPSNGLTDERCVAEICRDWIPADHDLPRSPEHVRDAIATGLVVDGFTLFALSWWLCGLDVAWPGDSPGDRVTTTAVAPRRRRLAGNLALPSERKPCLDPMPTSPAVAAVRRPFCSTSAASCSTPRPG